MISKDYPWSFDVADEVYDAGIIPWDKLVELFPVLDAMTKVEQNPSYHKEGNVFNHTKMVVEKLVSDYNWRNLFRCQRSALFLAALLHDVGKIDKTIEEEDGNFTSKGHSSSGARLIRQLLWDFRDDGFKVPFEIREYVSTLSLLHMLPVHFLDKEDPLYSVCASSYTLCNRNLSILADADNKGRTCNNDTSGCIELFGDFCIENHCYDEPRKFQSDHSRFLYFFNRVGHPDLNRYHDCKGSVNLMSGLPGAGKDRYIKKNLSHLPVVSLDDIRDEMNVRPMESEGEVFQLAKERCREYMRRGQDFVFNATNYMKQTRARWIRLFNQYNYSIEIHYIEPSFTILMKQNLNREKKVPEEIVRAMFKKMEPPTLLECHRLHLSV